MSGLPGDLLVGRRASEAHREIALRALDLALALPDVNRQPDRPALVREAALDRLADPEGRVGGELVALAPVELLRGADQAEDALLDEVEQRQLVALVALGQRDHQPQVGVDHALLRLEVAALDPLGELDLLLRRQERVPADVAQEELERVAGHDRQLVDGVARAGLGRAAAVVRHLDAALLQPVRERQRFLLGQVVRELGQLGEIDTAVLLAAVDKGLECAGAHELAVPSPGMVRTWLYAFTAVRTSGSSSPGTPAGRSRRRSTRPASSI